MTRYPWYIRVLRFFLWPVAVLTTLRQERRRMLQQTERERGFDYAAGQLLRGTSVNELEAQAYGWDGPSPFDHGISDALAAWRD